MRKIFKFIIERYLKLLTRIIISRHKPVIIAIAGSSNKTFIKDQILEEFKNEEKVRGNPRSFNTEIGLPLAVLFLPSGYSSIFKWVDVLLAGTYISVFKKNFPKILVLEMGIQKKGDMKYLLSIVQPKIAVVSDISGNFSDNKKTIDEEVSRLVRTINPNGKIILNADHERVRVLAEQAEAQVVFYGTKKTADVKIKNVRKNSDGQNFDLEIKGRKIHQQTELFGMHNVYALVAAKIVSEEIKNIIKNKVKK